jgi:hypothetical protein
VFTMIDRIQKALLRRSPKRPSKRQ